MGKPIKRDYEFNSDKYSKLLEKAVGGRSQAEFADICNISKSDLNKCINKKKKPHSTSTIFKIAPFAAGGVSLSDLLDAAGYEPRKFISNVYETRNNVAPNEQAITINEDLKLNHVNLYQFTDKTHDALCKQYSAIETDDGETLITKQVKDLQKRNAQLEEELLILTKAIAILMQHLNND